MKNLIILIALIFFINTGCKKKDYPEPVPTTAEASLYSEFMIDSTVINLKTGTENYYLYTSCEAEIPGVYTMKSDLSPIDCKGCPGSLRIQINDSRISKPGEPVNADEALKAGTYSFLRENNNTANLIQFAGLYNRPGATYSWDFGDGSTSTELNPSHQFQPGVHKVSFTAVSPDQCYSTITNTLNITSVSSPNAYIFVSRVDTFDVFHAGISGGKSPFTYLWNFGDGKNSQDSTTSNHFALKGTYAVKLTVTDADGQKAVANYNYINGSDPSFCAANYYVANFFKVDNSYILSKVRVDWVDESGVLYSSANIQQPGNAVFEIISTEDFINNRANEKVKRVKLRIVCLLFGQNKTKLFQSKEIFFAFSYK